MKRILHKNQIAITSLAVLVAVAGYLNFSGNDIPTASQAVSGTSSEAGTGQGKTSKARVGSGQTSETETDLGKTGKSKETSAKAAKKDRRADEDSLLSEAMEDPTEVEDSETIGEAVLTQAQVGEYTAGAKMKREQTRAKTKDALNQILDHEGLSEEAKQEAADKIARLADRIEKEAAVEELLSAKGYGEALVSISDDHVDVILNYDELSQSDRAQIEDIVTRKTGCSVSQIVISRMKLSRMRES